MIFVLKKVIPFCKRGVINMIKLDYNSKYQVIDNQFKEKIKKIRDSKRAIYTSIGILCISTSISILGNYIDLCKENKESVKLEIEENTTSLEVVDAYQEISIEIPKVVPIENMISKQEIDELKTEIEKYFQYYCDIYQVKKDVVYNKAVELTNNFTSPEWLESNYIPGTMVGGKARESKSQELGILLFVRHIKQIPEDFGFTSESLATGITYKLVISYEDFNKKICGLMEYLDPSLCQAIQYHETGRYNKNVKSFSENNNPAGLRDSSGNYWNFQNIAEGIIEIVIQMEYNYLINRNIASSSSIEEQITKIQQAYCPLEDETDHNNLNQYWIQGVTDIYYEITSEKQMGGNTR